MDKYPDEGARPGGNICLQMIMEIKYKNRHSQLKIVLKMSIFNICRFMILAKLKLDNSNFFIHIQLKSLQIIQAWPGVWDK